MSTHRKLNQKTITQFFRSLGRTSGGIAEKLKKTGITGVRGDGGYCPLANAATKHFGVPFQVGGSECEVAGTEYSLPDQCDIFVSEFVDGDYPELVEKS